MDSILQSIKKLLGIPEEDEYFDPDIIMHINSVLAILTQIGVGPVQGFSIKDASAKWIDFVQEDARLEFIKSYVGLKVRLLFDTPQSSALIESTNRMISELEFRILIATDPIEKESEEIQNE